MYDVMIPKNVCSNQLDVIHLDVGRMPLAVSFFCCFFWVRSASCAGPWAVVHHLGGSWDKRHAMQVLWSACRTPTSKGVETYEDYKHGDWCGCQGERGSQARVIKRKS